MQTRAACLQAQKRRLPLLSFGAMLLPAASAEACPPPQYRHCAPLIPVLLSDTRLSYHGEKGLSTNRDRKYRENTDAGGAYTRRLPASSRTTPPMNLGRRMHTIRTRISSPPACADQRPACADQRRSRHCCPGPPGDAQEQEQQARADERTAQQPPDPVIPVPPAGRTGLIPDFPHGSFPRFTASLCISVPDDERRKEHFSPFH